MKSVFVAALTNKLNNHGATIFLHYSDKEKSSAVTKNTNVAKLLAWTQNRTEGYRVRGVYHSRNCRGVFRIQSNT